VVISHAQPTNDSAREIQEGIDQEGKAGKGKYEGTKEGALMCAILRENTGFITSDKKIIARYSLRHSNSGSVVSPGLQIWVRILKRAFWGIFGVIAHPIRWMKRSGAGLRSGLRGTCNSLGKPVERHRYSVFLAIAISKRKAGDVCSAA